MRTSQFKRTGPITRKPKKRRTANPLKAGTLGKSKVNKGPARDKEHLARVRQHPCLMECDGKVVRTRGGWSTVGPVEAHHVRCLAPRSMGKRVSDYLTVPLCTPCHSALHERNEALHWKVAGIDPAEWIARFSKEGAAEIARIRNPADPT